jgi:hypothetical protein
VLLKAFTFFCKVIGTQAPRVALQNPRLAKTEAQNRRTVDVQKVKKPFFRFFYGSVAAPRKRIIRVIFRMASQRRSQKWLRIYWFAWMENQAKKYNEEVVIAFC